MCDTFCSLQGDRTLFAKSSDRPVGEPQIVTAHAALPAGPERLTQYLTLPGPGALAHVSSWPTWLFGAEHGVNEHRVAIGNEKVWTVEDAAATTPALIGMDLVRLVLERAADAEHGVEVVADLLAEHGQGGPCDEHGDAYYSSFLLADPTAAWVVETKGRDWAARRADPATDGGCAISNRITLGTDSTRVAPGLGPPGTLDVDTWRDPSTPTGHADRRLAVTRAAVATTQPPPGPRDLVATLRHHGGQPWGRPGAGEAPEPLPPTRVRRDGEGVTVCMHVRGYQVTAASMVAELPQDPEEPLRAWFALGAPCASVFVPAFPPHGVASVLGDPGTWAAFDGLRARVEQEPDALAAVRAVLDPVEADLWDEADAVAAAGAAPAAVAALLDRADQHVAAALGTL